MEDHQCMLVSFHLSFAAQSLDLLTIKVWTQAEKAQFGVRLSWDRLVFASRYLRGIALAVKDSAGRKVKGSEVQEVECGK